MTQLSREAYIKRRHELIMLIQGKDEYTMASEEVSQQAIDDLVLATIGQDEDPRSPDDRRRKIPYILFRNHVRAEQRAIVNGGKEKE